MNFGDFLDTNSCGGGGEGARIPPDLPYSDSSIMPTSAIPQSISFHSPALSLALQTGMEGQPDMVRMGDHQNYDSLSNIGVGMRRSRDDDSRSGSDNIDGAGGLGGGSGDDLDAADDKPPRKKRYHRHTPQQIQELEAMFKECPHPDEKQRMELSKRLCLDPRQVKFWFQNRRTQMKTQLERHENSMLRQENDKLRAENMSIRDAMRSPICTNCGGPAIIGEISIEEQHLRIENARLKDELDRVCALAGKFLGRPVSALPNSSLELGVGSNGFGDLGGVPAEFGMANSSPMGPVGSAKMTVNVNPMERSVYLEVALAAMDELVKMAQTNEPLWVESPVEGHQVLNNEEYSRGFNRCTGMNPGGFVAEASRETGVVIVNSLALVETLMDSNKWAEMFPCIVARTSTTSVMSNGMGGTRNGALQLVDQRLRKDKIAAEKQLAKYNYPCLCNKTSGMSAAFQVLSPLVPVREVNFLRFCKQHAEGVWAVVDVSVDGIRETTTSGGGPGFPTSLRLPSGCLVQDMPNGYSKVTWVEHVEYDENLVHELYRPMVAAGMGFGARRWVATLQRQCEFLAIIMSSTIPARDHNAGITAGGRRSMLKLAQRMTNNFCAGICASSNDKWSKLHTDNVDENVQVMTRKSVDDPGEPPGIVVSAATSVWLPVSPQQLFDFLRDERLRSEWDILSNGGPVQEMAHIAKGQDNGNCVSLLRAGAAASSSQSSMLILQETCVDAAGSLVVYAPVDIPAMHVVMNGGDSAYVALLPSGFAIVPDGPGSRGPTSNGPTGNGGSLLTVAFQILVNSLPTAKLTVESVETVNNLISCTVQKIKAALHGEG